MKTKTVPSGTLPNPGDLIHFHLESFVSRPFFYPVGDDWLDDFDIEEFSTVEKGTLAMVIASFTETSGSIVLMQSGELWWLSLSQLGCLNVCKQCTQILECIDTCIT